MVAQRVPPISRTGLMASVRTITTTTTLTAADEVVYVDTTAGVVSVTLPTASTLWQGKTYTIQKITADANQVNVAGSIDGYANLRMYRPRERIVVYNTGSAWKRADHSEPYVLSIAAYGARGDAAAGSATATANSNALGSAIADAAARGSSQTGRQGVVLVPDGFFRVADYVALLRGTNADQTVHLMGVSAQSSVLKGDDTDFPEGKGVVGWDVVERRAWNQSISNLRIIAPNKANTACIWYHKASAGDTTADYTDEWLQLDLYNVQLNGSNEFHERLMMFEVGCRQASWRKVWGDVSLGNEWVSDTYLAETIGDYVDERGALYGEDTIGFCFMDMQAIFSLRMISGMVGAFKGRFNGSSVDTVFCTGGMAAPSFDLVNATDTTFTNVRSEGRGGQPDYRLVNPYFVTFSDWGIGTPDDQGGGVGNGIEIYGGKHCRFHNRVVVPGAAPWSTHGKKAIYVDSASENVIFTNFGLNEATPNTAAAELDIQGTNCQASGYAVSGSIASPTWTRYVAGNSPVYTAALTGSETKDWGSIADGDNLTEAVTVNGAALGDYAEAAMTMSLQGLQLTAYVSAANTVTCVLSNTTGAAVDLGSGTLKVSVRKG